MRTFSFSRLCIGGVFILGVASAWANPFPKGSAVEGKKLHDAKCAGCHNTMFPDKDGRQLYSDLFRKVETAPALRGMITMCANRSRAGWFEEEIEHAGRYLNDAFYKFK